MDQRRWASTWRASRRARGCASWSARGSRRAAPRQVPAASTPIAPQSMLVHLGMTGRLRIHAQAATRARRTPTSCSGSASASCGSSIARRFGQIDVVDARRASASTPALAVLGPDPLDRRRSTSRALLATRAAASAHAQGVRARSERDRRGRQHLRVRGAVAREAAADDAARIELTAASAARLAAAIREVLDARARQRRHDALRDFVDADGTRRRERGLSVGLRARRASRVRGARRRSGDPSSKDGQRITVQRVRPRKRSTAWALRSRFARGSIVG